MKFNLTDEYDARCSDARHNVFWSCVEILMLSMSFGALLALAVLHGDVAAQESWRHLPSYVMGAVAGGLSCGFIQLALLQLTGWYERQVTMVANEYTQPEIRWRTDRYILISALGNPIGLPIGAVVLTGFIIYKIFDRSAGHLARIKVSKGLQ